MSLSNNRDNKIVPIMHGENFMVPVSELPSGKVQTAKVYVVGHSETGHNHVLTSKSDLQIVENGVDRYVLVSEVSELYHKKAFDIHETIAVEPGVYKITHKTEYDPFQQVIRQVWD